MISFVVPAHNEELLLGNTLRAMHQAAGALGEPYEVVVVDDGSTDTTALVATQAGARVVPVAYRQISATRNAGARAARGEYLMFVDADTLVSESVIAAALSAMKHGSVGGGAGVRCDGRIPLYARVMLPLTVVLFRLARLAAGCFVFCTRQAFERTGGFDEALFGGEEVAFSRALSREGRVVIVRGNVITSGRKLRAYSGWEIIRVFMALAVRGTRAVRSRDRMDLWYGPRREDPGG